jgi:O-antigen ligase
LPLVLALALFDDDKRTRRAFALVAIPLALGLYLTYSRGAWLIGLPAGLIALGLMSGRRVRLAVIALIVLAASALIPFLQTERAQSLFQAGTGTGFFRVSVWESGVAMIRDHPILGVGLDNFLYEYPKYINPDAWREPNLSHPHNIVLDFWTRLGALGVIALVWMLIAFYKTGKRIGKHRALVIGLIASMTAALAHGLIDAAYFYVDLAFVWMLTLGIIAQAERLRD